MNSVLSLFLSRRFLRNMVRVYDLRPGASALIVAEQPTVLAARLTDLGVDATGCLTSVINSCTGGDGDMLYRLRRNFGGRAEERFEAVIVADARLFSGALGSAASLGVSAGLLPLVSPGGCYGLALPVPPSSVTASTQRVVDHLATFDRHPTVGSVGTTIAVRVVRRGLFRKQPAIAMATMRVPDTDVCREDWLQRVAAARPDLFPREPSRSAA